MCRQAPSDGDVLELVVVAAPPHEYVFTDGAL